MAPHPTNPTDQNDQDGLTPEQRQILAAQQSVARRIQIRDALLKKYAPELSGEGTAPGGMIGKVHHLSGMKEEAVAAALIADLILFILQFLANTPHRLHKNQFKELLQIQLRYQAKGEPLHLVYMPDSHGVFPDVYKIDELTGELDYTQTYPNGQAPREAVRLNGLVPKPTRQEGLENAMNMHMQRMFGNNVLSMSDQLKLKNMLLAEDQTDAKHDKVRDTMMYRMRPGGTR